MQLTQAALDGVLSNIISTGNEFDPASTWLGVATGIVDNGLATTMANVSPASGAMSARVKMSPWGSVQHLISGLSAVDGPLASFTPASSAEAQSLVAWFLATASAGGNLIAYSLINPQVNLPDQYHSWMLVLRLTVDPSGTWDVSVAFDG